MRLFIVGSSPATSGHAMAGLSLSIAAILGQLANHPILLIDMSERPKIIRAELQVDDNRGLEAIVNQFDFTPLSSNAISIPTALLTSQIHQILPISGNNIAIKRQFDLLPGPARITPNYFDRLREQRGAEFVEELIKSAASLVYEFIIIDIGRKIDTLLGIAAIKHANLLGIAYENVDECAYWWSGRFVEHIQFLQDINYQIIDISQKQYAFPHPTFADSLHRSFKPKNGMSRTALNFVEKIQPSISNELSDFNGKTIRPHNFLDKINNLLPE